MFLNRRISFKVILQFAWKVQLAAFLWSFAAYVAYHFFDVKAIAIPFLPVATIGTAVAFYVGFKNNSAYDGTAWLVIPFTMLIAWVFNVMEQVGDASENPFDNGINDIPMTAICCNIEIEFKELLNEKDLPPQLKPVNGILM